MIKKGDVVLRDRFVPEEAWKAYGGFRIGHCSKEEVRDLALAYREYSQRGMTPIEKPRPLATGAPVIKKYYADPDRDIDKEVGRMIPTPQLEVLCWDGTGVRGTLEKINTILSFQAYPGSSVLVKASEGMPEHLEVKIGHNQYKIVPTADGDIRQKIALRTEAPPSDWIQYGNLYSTHGHLTTELLKEWWKEANGSDEAWRDIEREWTRNGSIVLRFTSHQRTWLFSRAINHLVKRWRDIPYGQCPPRLDEFEEIRAVDEDDRWRIARTTLGDWLAEFQWPFPGYRNLPGVIVRGGEAPRQQYLERTVPVEAWDLLKKCSEMKLPMVLPSWWTTSGVAQNNGSLNHLCQGNGWAEKGGFWATVENARTLAGNDHWTYFGGGGSTPMTSITGWPPLWIDQYRELLSKYIGERTEEKSTRLPAYWLDVACGLIGGLPVLVEVGGWGWGAFYPSKTCALWTDNHLTRSHLSRGRKAVSPKVDKEREDRIMDAAVAPVVRENPGKFPYMERVLSLADLEQPRYFLQDYFSRIEPTVMLGERRIELRRPYRYYRGVLGEFATSGSMLQCWTNPLLAGQRIAPDLWGKELSGTYVKGTREQINGCYWCGAYTLDKDAIRGTDNRVRGKCCKNAAYAGRAGMSLMTGVWLDDSDDPYPPLRCEHCDTRFLCLCEDRCLVCGGTGNACVCTRALQVLSNFWKDWRKKHPEPLPDPLPGAELLNIWLQPEVYREPEVATTGDEQGRTTGLGGVGAHQATRIIPNFNDLVREWDLWRPG